MIDVSKVNWTKIYDYANQIVQMYRDNLSKAKVDASGNLSRSVDFDLDFDSYHVTIYLIMESYWYYIEKGETIRFRELGRAVITPVEGEQVAIVEVIGQSTEPTTDGIR